MMRRLVALVFSLTSIVWAGTALAQPSRELRVQVFHLGENGEKVYESGIVVTWQETGSHRETTDQGIARLPLPLAFPPGAKITLSVDKPNWRIRYPLDGEARIPDTPLEPIKVELLPVGSKLFWTNDRIEKFIQDTAEKAKRAAQPKAHDGGTTVGKELDLGRYIKEWAVRYGFTPQDAQKEIDRWIAETEANQNDVYKLGLAAFAKKQFGDAARYFHDSADSDARQIEEVERRQETLAEKKAQLRLKQIRDLRLEGDSYFQNHDYGKALAVYEAAHNHASQTETAELWAATFIDVSLAHWRLGTEGSSAESTAHLEQAIQACRQALVVYAREQNPEGWAMTQSNLGNALQEQATRTEGERGAQLLKEAVEAYSNTLLVYTREKLPQDWAMTQNNLGIALKGQGTRTEGQQGPQLLADAVEAYKRALLVYTREQLPQDWAMTQNNLGVALKEQGIRTEGQQGSQLLADAVDTFKQALLVYTREQLPQDWAMTQNNLGVALQEQGTRTEGQQGSQLLADAVDTFKQALLVYTREQFQQHWAITENNLGNTLYQQGVRTKGQQGAQLLADAVEAYRKALLVYTRDLLPQDWAMAQNNLGNALTEQGTRTEGERGARLLAAAVEAYKQALLVYTRKQLPQEWATTQNNLGAALEEQGTRTEDQKGTQLLAEAVEAYKQALLVRTREQLPQGWATTQYNLGVALLTEGMRTEGERSSQLFTEAGTSFHHALDVFTYEQFSRQWNMARRAEAHALLLAGHYQEAASGLSDILARNPTDAAAANLLVIILNDHLFDHHRALQVVQQWLANNQGEPRPRLLEVEVLFASGDFSGCQGKAAALLGASGLPENAKVVLLCYEAAVAMATGDSAGALTSLAKEVAAQPAEFSTGWDFPGTLHSLQKHPEIPHRDGIVRLFKLLEAKDRDSITQGLQALQAELATSR